MRILAVADEECKSLWDYYKPEKLAGVDMIVCCGDLSAHYVSFLATMAPLPVIYVHGNHDESYDQNPPGGAICIDDDVFVYKALCRPGRQLPLPGGSLAVYRGRDARPHPPPARTDRPHGRGGCGSHPCPHARLRGF